MEYEYMIPPVKNYDFFEFTKEEAKIYFNWYMEEKGEKERKSLENLENHIEEYDLILIDNVRSLNKWTCHIFKAWERLGGKPIFCMNKGEIITWIRK